MPTRRSVLYTSQHCTIVYVTVLFYFSNTTFKQQPCREGTEGAWPNAPTCSHAEDSRQIVIGVCMLVWFLRLTL